jgi:hypothetical protein
MGDAVDHVSTPAQGSRGGLPARYYMAYGVMSIGKMLCLISLPWMVMHRTNTLDTMAILLILVAAQDLVTTAFVGVVVDRMRRSTCAAMADAGRCAVTAAIGLFTYLDLPVVLIALTALCYFPFDRIATSAAGALIPEHVPPTALLKVNAKLQILFQLAGLTAAIAGGAALHLVGSAGTFLLIAASFLVSSLLFASLPTVPGPASAPPGPAARAPTTIFRDIAGGLRLVLRNRSIAANAIAQAALWIILDLANVLSPYFSMKELRINAFQFGVLDASWAVGAGALSFVLAGGRRAQGLERSLLRSGLLAIGGFLFAFSLIQSYAAALLGFVALGACFASTRVALEVESYRIVPIDALGRVRAAAQLIASLGTIVTFVVLIALEGVVGAARLYWVGAGLCVLVIAMRALLARADEVGAAAARDAPAS